MREIGIIGAGFFGAMTGVHLLRTATVPFRLTLINQDEHFGKGIAYNPYSKHQLLNVPAAKMSALPEEPGHFLDWVMQQEHFRKEDRDIVACSFLPRYLYGSYLTQLWERTLEFSRGKVEVRMIRDRVDDLDVS